MAYRRDSQKDRAWRNWLGTHREALDACRLPPSVLANEDTWWDFLMHGHLAHHGTDTFKVDDLTREQMQALHTFLEAELSESQKQTALVLHELRFALRSEPEPRRPARRTRA